MLESVASPEFGLAPGDEVDVTPEQAEIWVRSGRAEVVRPGVVTETPELSARRRGPSVITPETRRVARAAHP